MSLHMSVSAHRREVTVCSLIALVVSGHAMMRSAPQTTRPDDAIPPLVAASLERDLDAVKRLLAEGADPDAHIGDRAAWMWAIVARDDRATELLLSKVSRSTAQSLCCIGLYSRDLSRAVHLRVWAIRPS